MSDPICYFDGRYLPASDVRISPFDRGFTLGDGLFETMRAYGGRMFRLPDHMARLSCGAGVLGLRLPGGLADAVVGVLAANRWSDAVLRLTVTRGVASPSRGGLLPDPGIAATVLVTGRDLTDHPPYPVPFYEQGMRLATCGPARDERSPLSALKTLNYLPQILLRQEAARLGADEALQLNTAGHVVGASVANVFLVQDSVLVTPSLASGCLPGITRAVVLELALAHGLTVEERAVMRTDVDVAAEVFLANTLMEIAPVAAIDSHTYEQAPGPVMALLAQAFRDYVRSGAA